MLRLASALVLLAASAGAHGVEFDARVQWYTTAQVLPAEDVTRAVIDERRTVDHGVDLRLMVREDFGPFRLSIDHATTWLYGDSALGSLTGPTFDQTPTGDGHRAMQLAWDIDQSSRSRGFHRFDRFALEYRQGTIGVTVGRQAVSWGSGVVFQPFDLFNPFAPTTVARDYKPGDDLILIEKLFENGNDLQLLAVARRGDSGHAERAASSFAAKYRHAVGESELELMSARHRNENVYGIGMRIPVGGALVRSDVTATRLRDGSWVTSGVLNADYGFSIKDRAIYVFGEYYKNGFGVDEIDLTRLPAELIERVGNGEIFNLGRDYLALGTQVQWHVLLGQSLSWIQNLNDSSGVLSASFNVEAGDNTQIQLGVIKPIGGFGAEFGQLPVPGGATIGGGTRGVFRLVHFFM